MVTSIVRFTPPFYSRLLRGKNIIHFSSVLSVVPYCDIQIPDQDFCIYWSKCKATKFESQQTLKPTFPVM